MYLTWQLTIILYNKFCFFTLPSLTNDYYSAIEWSLPVCCLEVNCCVSATWYLVVGRVQKRNLSSNNLPTEETLESVYIIDSTRKGPLTHSNPSSFTWTGIYYWTQNKRWYIHKPHVYYLKMDTVDGSACCRRWEVLCPLASGLSSSYITEIFSPLLTIPSARTSFTTTNMLRVTTYKLIWTQTIHKHWSHQRIANTTESCPDHQRCVPALSASS